MILLPIILFAALLNGQHNLEEKDKSKTYKNFDDQTGPIIANFNEIPGEKKVIIDTKRIAFNEFPDAFNPSLIKTPEGFILTFRYCPDPVFIHYVSYIGIALLNDHFEPISKPQLLNTRYINHYIPSQSEDARIFSYRGRLFLIFNDNPDTLCPEVFETRDMFIAELFYRSGEFDISLPLKLFCKEKEKQLWQKNWVPLVWNKNLLFGYSINPHEILQPNLLTGECYSVYKTNPPIDWNFGILRGSGPALLVDGEYLAFFHSGIPIPPELKELPDAWFYFMGAYTFTPDPPFTVTKMTPIPIFNDGFYIPEAKDKKVIFPGGFVDAGDFIYLAYGKDDKEIWIATLDKKTLKETLKPIPKK